MKLSRVALVFFTVAAAFGASAAGVSAQTSQDQNQNVDQQLKVNCTTGAYGQTSECTAEGTQTAEQRQRQVLGDEFITLADGTVIRRHIPVDTGLDTKMMALAVGVFVLGAGAAVAYRKSLAR